MLALCHFSSARETENMEDMPSTLVTDHRTETLTKETIPAELLSFHTNDAGVWGMIRVLAGELELHVEGGEEPVKTLAKRKPGIIDPDHPFKLVPASDDLRFYIQYFKEPI